VKFEEKHKTSMACSIIAAATNAAKSGLIKQMAKAITETPA